MPGPLKLVFAGTPAYALPALEVALSGPDTLLAVYTQPDRPAGRGRKLTPSPVKQRALAAGVEVRQPLGFRHAADRDALAALAPDLMIVIAYGLILPKSVLAIPRLGCWNLHASLLPRWRGAAPIQRAIEAGDAHTGVCLMQMEAGLDTGPVLLQQSTVIGAEETAGELHDRLARLSGEVLAEGIARLRDGTLPAAQPQPLQGLAYAHKIDKSEARLQWTQPADMLARKVRAFSPWPVAEAELAGERVRVHAARAIARERDAAPGELLVADARGIDIACGQGTLRLLTLQRDGGRPVSAADYLNARPELRRS